MLCNKIWITMDAYYRLLLVTLLLLLSDITEAQDTLYAPDDPIVQLNVDNYDQVMTSTPNAWVVEFYATWCGHCQRFAPIYKQYAADIAGWSKVIRVAAIACSDPKNLPVCRKMNIRGFPTVKFFPPNMSSVTRGFKLTSLRYHIGSIRAATLTFIDDYVIRSPGSFPSITTYSTTQELVDIARTNGASYLFGIVDDGLTAGKNDLAKAVILDMSSDYPRVTIGRLSKSAILDPDSLWQPLPSVVSVSLQDGSVRFVTQLNNRDDVKRVIKTLSSGSWNLDVTTPLPSIPVRPPTPPLDTYVKPVRPTGQELPLVIPLQTTTQVVPEAEHPDQGQGAGGNVSLANPGYQYSPAQSLELSDLDSNIYYMLWNEVPNRIRIRGSALSALKKYLSVLAKYHPSDTRLSTFLDTVYNWVKLIGRSLDSTLYLNTVEGLQTSDSYVTKELDWASCDGSQSRFRGYPCSLWMTFHALTVAAYENHLQNPQEPFDPMEVLGAIRDYVRQFLGCRECADHFYQMAQHMEREISQPVDVILWLWWGHNRVNNRLHGDETEDPAHPKIQFPGPINCPTCGLEDGPIDKFNNETIWNIPEVIKFLRKFYAKDNILDYPPSTTLPSLLTSTLPTMMETLGLRDSYNPDRRGSHTDSLGPRHPSNSDTRSNSDHLNLPQPNIHRERVHPNEQTTDTHRDHVRITTAPRGTHRDNVPDVNRDNVNAHVPRSDRRREDEYHNVRPVNSNPELPRNSYRATVPPSIYTNRPREHVNHNVPPVNPDPEVSRNNYRATVPPNVYTNRPRDNLNHNVPQVNPDPEVPRNSYRATVPPNVHTKPVREDRHHRLTPRNHQVPAVNVQVDERSDRQHHIEGAREPRPESSRVPHHHTSSRQTEPDTSRRSSIYDLQRQREPVYGDRSDRYSAYVNPGDLQAANDPVPRRTSLSLRTVVTELPSVRRSNGSCVAEAGTWSACTVTCDTGISTRLSNDNDQCEMRMEMRICQIRPCSFNIGNPRPGGSQDYCTANMRSATHTALTFNGCTTLKGYTWRFCNRCPGYCCQPTSESTFWTDVICQHGNEAKIGSMPISWIVGCHCRRGNC